MKKYVFFAAWAAVSLFSACNSCNGNGQEGVIIESDSMYMLNDSTVAGVQTFVFEGTAPMADNALADVMLAVSTVSLNEDGTFTITTDYIDEGLATQTDNGDAIIIMGGGNDSTATIIQLMSANNMPAVNFMMMQDSSLVKVDKNGKPVSNNPGHKLTIQK